MAEWLGGGKEVAAVKSWTSGAARSTCLMALVLGMLLLGGCYEIPQEVIPARLGEIVPDAPDQADFDGGGKILLSRGTTNNDYRFRDVSYAGSERQGTVRAMHIKDNIYAVQARYDDESKYQIIFYAIDSRQIRFADVTKATDLKTFASLYGVEYRADELNKGFAGKPGKILAMLKGMCAVDFEP